MKSCKERVFNKIKFYRDIAHQRGVKFRPRDLRRLELEIPIPEISNFSDVFSYHYDTGTIVLTETSVALLPTTPLEDAIFQDNWLLKSIPKDPGFVGAQVVVPLKYS